MSNLTLNNSHTQTRQFSSYIVAVSFIGIGKPLTNLITCSCIEHTSPPVGKEPG